MERGPAVRILLIGLVITGVVACASKPVPQSSELPIAFPQPAERNGTDYWWYARFRMSWPEGETPDFASNLIVANEVVAPVLRMHGADIRLWRFHRRAARDAAGHQFSFIFYTTTETAEEIFSTIRQNPVVEQLIADGLVLKLILGDPANPGSSEIAATSDPSWAPSIRKSWPYFITGVSLMFLEMLENEIDENELRRLHSPMERLDYYVRVNDRLTALWRAQGRHAFFHHISVIFGYEPIDMRF